MTTTQFGAKLAESGLTAQDAKKLGMRLLTASQTAALQPHYREVPAMLIPYFKPDGTPMDFHRVRYFGPVSTFTQGRKYDGPSGHPPRAYFPKITPWSTILEDVRVQLIITEGELKAACASKLGLPTIGLGGVWSFRSRRLGIEFLPELEAFKWEGRHVELCFDSDIVVKPEVRQALEALSRELARRGARLSLVNLPQDGDDKVGLDDFLVKHGRQAYQNLERASIHPNEARRREFINRYVYVMDEDQILDLDNNICFRGKQHFLNATSEEKILTADGKSRNLSAEWFDSKERQKYPSYIFDPRTPNRFLPGRGVNRYQGLAVEPRRGSVEPMLKLIDSIVGRRPEIRRWFLQWLAYPLQNPGVKLSSCVFVFSPKQGVGKTAVGEVMIDIYGPTTHGVNLTEEDFFGDWNDWLEHSLFGLCDELSFDGTKKSRSVFKRHITGENAILSGKWRKRVAISNRCNFYFTSNSPGGLPLEVGTNRRVLVLEAQGTVGKEYLLGEFDRWRNQEQGPARWLYYLLHHVDTAEFNPRMDAPTTHEEQLAVESSSGHVDLWLREHLEQPPFTASDIWTAQQVLAVYQLETNDHRPSTAAINRALAATGGARLQAVVLGGRQEHSIWAVRNVERWRRASNQQIRQEWDRGNARG